MITRSGIFEKGFELCNLAFRSSNFFHLNAINIRQYSRVLFAKISRVFFNHFRINWDTFENSVYGKMMLNNIKFMYVFISSYAVCL